METVRILKSLPKHLFRGPGHFSEDPIRGELFSIVRLEQHAESLSAAQRIMLKPSRGRRLLSRVRDNSKTLALSHRRIARAVAEKHPIPPAAEWLLDNFHVIEEQVREIHDDLPPSFYRELPKLTDGFLKGYPRILGITWAFVAHTDSRLDADWLRRFIRAYQRSGPLHIGEIWALAISLRIVLVENLRRLAERITLGLDAREEANALADTLLGIKGRKENSAAPLYPDEATPLSRAFALQLLQRFRDHEGPAAPALVWVNKRLAAQDANAEDIVRLELQEQAAMNTTVRNVITSMRLLSALDWAKFFEDVSMVDEILRAESGFGSMDFYTRDIYRHAIEDLSRGSGLSEVEVARKAIWCAKSARLSLEKLPDASPTEMEREGDPGYHLISKGRLRFEKEIAYHVSFKHHFLRAYVGWAAPGYVGSLQLASCFFLAVPALISNDRGMSVLTLLSLAVLNFIPATNLAVALVNRLVMMSLGPRPLPKLDLHLGIPKDFSTLLVVPTILTSIESIKENMENLETHYLCNPNGYLQFSLLTDWADAPEEHMPDDDALLAAALAGAKRLNERHGPGPAENARFLVLHRRRVWNANEGVWMGWERKRGKLCELNRLLRGDANTTYLDTADSISKIRYVITLDSDTRVSQGLAYRLVGTMAHPLNRPRFERETGRVVEGYGVVQPRITPTLPTLGNGSIYQKIFSGPAGIDPYAFAVSDVYQDLFKEGSYVGKGIYDVDAFEASLAGRVPENTLLSHDLFEGLYARTGLATDVELFEEFPSDYKVSAARVHRWVRGDWQLLPWIAGRASRARSARQEKPLPLIGRWKMLDNLRRSLSPPALFLSLLCAWTLRNDLPWVWTIFTLSAIGLPLLWPAVASFLFLRGRISMTIHLRVLWADLRMALAHFGLEMAFLAHQAWMMSDAIIRTLYRLGISGRHLLVWTCGARSNNLRDLEPGSFFKSMSPAPVLGLAALGFAFAFGSEVQFWMACPFAILWSLSPFIAQRISLPIKSVVARPLSAEDHLYLRLVARKTWSFFETFVNAAHHDLPPDNFQEIPVLVVANRTSPTNIGLYLLSTLAAREFGWLGALDTLERLERTLNTVKNLRHHEGHLFNWYDTFSLRPLEPLYVSTVDSGNFAGHLWAVANACRKFATRPFPGKEILAGFEDVLRLVNREALNIHNDRRTATVTRAQLLDAVSDIQKTLQAVPVSPADWRVCLEEIDGKVTTLVDIARALACGPPDNSKKEILKWSECFHRQVISHARDLKELMVRETRDQAGEISPGVIRRFSSLALACDQMVQEMSFGFLFDPDRNIFFIGFQAAERKTDNSYYDLLASEARLASFVAIAKGDVPAKHWFHLTRSLVPVENGLALLSWSGSMFEYLMPYLVMSTPADSLLGRTCELVVRKQISYGHLRGVPWGISESAYNAQNLEFTYQYSDFGVPGLGMRRRLSEDLLISPYATALAAMIDPDAAAKNFRALSSLGAEGSFGFYEALDFTPLRLPKDQKMAVVRAYMSHHQGMSLVSLANALCNGAIQAFFHAEPKVQATELLLQERTPRNVQVLQVHSEEAEGAEIRELTHPPLRRFHSPYSALPQTHLLSNGRYSVMINAAGSGFSKWRNLSVTRWREDATCDAWGTYVFMRDVKSGNVWSAGFQPTGTEPESYEVDFSDYRAEIIRRDGSLVTTLEVVVSPEDDAEIRRVSIQNIGSGVREIDITSYAEIVLAQAAADDAHPMFSNLFIETEFVPEVNGLICSRRPRSPDDPPLWAAHVMVVEGETLGTVGYESDRAQFLGRGRDVRKPMSVIDGGPLSNSSGAVLDPIVSLRRRVQIRPKETVRAAFTTLIASSREKAIALADKYHDPAMFQRTITLAWTHAHIQQHHLGIDPGEAHIFQDLASRIIYSNSDLRPSSDILKRNRLGTQGLWAHGISGDIPIVLLRIDEADDRGIVRELLRANEYWRMKNLDVDLVILNEKPPSYSKELQSSLESLVRTNQTASNSQASALTGGVFVLRAELLSVENQTLLRAAARITFLSRQGTLVQQAGRLETLRENSISYISRKRPRDPAIASMPFSMPALQFFNGLGGFSQDGREYVTALAPGQWTPAPWINVVANPDFGFQVSESGSGFTWSVNSRENQLTPWSNDPVCDPSGEALYIKDEESGEFWTPTALPIREEHNPYVARHGQGYSRFEYSAHGIAAHLLQFVPVKDPIKISRLTLTNFSGRHRHLSVTGYVEWVLGNKRSVSAPFILTEVDHETHAMLASNLSNNEFSGRVAFADMAGHQTSWTADRAEFLGRNGTRDHPRAIEQKVSLSEKTGTGFDPCCAMRTSLELKPGESAEILFFLGQGKDRAAALELIKRYRSANLNAEFARVRDQWDDILGAVQVRTPERSMDLLMNRGLLYQTLACRLWARSGFYQAGGAYGFRDQLQDVMALSAPKPDLARKHILEAAARQFVEGDVQHWWHPPSGRGVRTRISDDLLWLPYVVLHYVETTGDAGILEEAIPFLEGETVSPGKEDAYFKPTTSFQRGSVFEHCARALDRSLAVGSHGLPLMGTGDWNDGMNRVGREGKGESVWLAWFLHTTLWEFSKLAEKRGEFNRAEKWRLHVGELKAAVERNGWDGNWYLRAYFDDGTPLGSATNEECRIDSIAQSWAVISGAGDPARAARAMAALDERLVLRRDRLVLLCAPPFNLMTPNPGYIQGYLPGVRENGGQYTHAAVWAAIAFAALGDGDKAWELFSILNPINRSSSRADIHRYKVEPYVLAADVYAQAPHVGRGGWTWYTGSSSWMYRAGLEWILGFRLRGTFLIMDPCIPASWRGFEITFRYHSSIYQVVVENPNGVFRGMVLTEMDGKPVRSEAPIPLSNDGTIHKIRVVLGRKLRLQKVNNNFTSAQSPSSL